MCIATFIFMISITLSSIHSGCVTFFVLSSLYLILCLVHHIYFLFQSVVFHVTCQSGVKTVKIQKLTFLNTLMFGFAYCLQC